jgi:hypothetical protein
LSAKADRLLVNAEITKAIAEAAKCVEKCPKLKTVQALDVQVRDTYNKSMPAAGAKVKVIGGGGTVKSGLTDADGDIIFRLPSGEYTVTAEKDWHVPDPASAKVTLGENTLLVVPLVLEELRYYLHVDGDRDGDIDDRHEGLNVIRPWQWGAAARGAVVLCNNDHDDGVFPISARKLDNEDLVVNLNQDGSHDVAAFEIRRVGPTTAPPLAKNWTATLEILDGKEDKLKIFTGVAPGSLRLLGAGAGAAAAVQNTVISLHVAGAPPTSYPTTTFGMEATTYPVSGFNGLIRLKLTVKSGGPQYYTAAEVRVAPWMMPNHLDDVRRVYVTDLGMDSLHPVEPTIIEEGNSTFRAAIGGLIGVPLIATANTDRWMQDCMEVGYSVVPRNAGGNKRHRIEAVMQAYRDHGLDDLKEHPRSLLDADFGFHFPASVSTAKSYSDAFLVGPGLTTVYQSALLWALKGLAAEGAQSSLLPEWSKSDSEKALDDMENGVAPVVPARVLTAAKAAALAAEAALRAAGSVAAAKASMASSARGALNGEGAPFNGIVATEVAEFVAHGAAEGVNRTTTYDAHGNLECTPPCKAGGKEYPWGRIYHGKGAPGKLFDAPTREFLDAQRVQAPIALDTSWLSVGHVDEMITFVPAPGAKYKNWKMLAASPREAFRILDLMPPTTPVMKNCFVRESNSYTPVTMTAAQMRSGAVATTIKNPDTRVAMTGQQLRDYNLLTIQPKLNTAVTTLCAAIGIAPADVIQVPVVFMPIDTMNKSIALTSDMVNMLVVGNRLIVPAPFGPIHPVGLKDEFEEDLKTDLLAVNPALDIRFVNDWYTYHDMRGEIHCATNTNRRPTDMTAWLASIDAEWWRFQP